MSDENMTSPVERDASGRFVRKASDEVEARPPVDTSDMHPIAKALFGWVSWPGTGSLVFWGLAALSAALIIGDLALIRHDKVESANATGFYGAYGFASFALVVLAGWPLGRLLRRPEDYYDDGDET